MKIFAVCAAFLAVFFITACDLEMETGNYKSFDYGLQGTWLSNDTSVYSGALIIDNNRITITGYSEDQTPFGKNVNTRPFKGFTKGVPLKGYSEEGKFFIEDGGILQEGIPFTYWDDYPPPDYRKIKFLRFTFGDRVETLQKK